VCMGGRVRACIRSHLSFWVTLPSPRLLRKVYLRPSVHHNNGAILWVMGG